MRCPNRFILLLFAVLANIGCIALTAWAQSRQLECPQMGVIVNVPDGWKVGDPKDVHPSAVSENGAAKVVLLYFEKQWLFEVMNSAKVVANFMPALHDASLDESEQAVINTLVGMKLSGTGTLHGKPVQFKSVLVGDRDNSTPNTLVVIVVASEAAMKQQATEIASILESVRPQGAK